jgi:hypothetical protein
MSMEVVAQLATALWRTRRRMIDPETREPFASMAKVHHHLSAAFDALTQLGITIHDHAGEIFSGQSLRVITFQPVPGMLREKITETVRPGIYWNGHLLQLEEVIVGTPAQAPRHESAGHDTGR